MERIPLSECKACPKTSYYEPHHLVVNPNSSTTKLRVVFYASVKTASNVSLNDVLKVGPKIKTIFSRCLFAFVGIKLLFMQTFAKYTAPFSCIRKKQLFNTSCSVILLISPLKSKYCFLSLIKLRVHRGWLQNTYNNWWKMKGYSF